MYLSFIEPITVPLYIFFCDYFMVVCHLSQATHAVGSDELLRSVFDIKVRFLPQLL